MNVQTSVAEQFRVSPQRAADLSKFGFSADEIYRIVAPRRTLDRRKKNNETLTLAESDREAIHRLLERLGLRLWHDALGNVDSEGRLLLLDGLSEPPEPAASDGASVETADAGALEAPAAR